MMFFIFNTQRYITVTEHNAPDEYLCWELLKAWAVVFFLLSLWVNIQYMFLPDGILC